MIGSIVGQPRFGISSHDRSSSAFAPRTYFSASPIVVFEAWTKPAIMKRWMFVGTGNTIYKAQTDLRIGGAFSILKWSGSEHIDHSGQYREIGGPHHFAFTLLVPKHFTGCTLVIVDIEADGPNARLTFEQSGVSKQIVEKAWHQMFDALDKVLREAF
jgi:uncharacterized protein YndB with AHSA1/START domain